MRAFLAAVLLAIGVPALAQIGPGAAQFGSIQGTTPSVFSVYGASGGTLQVTGTWVATLAFESTTDNGTTWNAMGCTSAGVSASTTTANVTCTFSNGGFNNIRVRASAFTSGTASLAVTTTASTNFIDSTGTATGPILLTNGSAAAPSLAFANQTGTGFSYAIPGIYVSTAGTLSQYFSANGINLTQSGAYAWSTGVSPGSASDLFLLRDAANTLAQRNGPNGQTFNIYNTYTSGSINEALYVGWSANVAAIVTTNVGAVSRPMYIGTQGASALSFRTSNTDQWQVTSGGNLADLGSHTITAGSSISAGAANNFAWTTRSVMGAPGDGLVQLLNNAQTGFTRLILGTNDATTSGASWNLNGGALEAKKGDSSAYADVNMAGAQLINKVSRYNNVVTAGWGVPSIVAAGRATAQTAANASVTTYTVGAADGSFEVSANVLVTASTTHSFNVNVAYTDEGNTARTVPMLVVAPGSVSAFTIANAQGAVPWSAAPLHIRAKAATTITVTTSGTFTSVTYNVDGSIRQIS